MLFKNKSVHASGSCMKPYSESLDISHIRAELLVRKCWIFNSEEFWTIFAGMCEVGLSKICIYSTFILVILVINNDWVAMIKTVVSFYENHDNMLIICWFTLYLQRTTSLVFHVEQILWLGLSVATLIYLKNPQSSNNCSKCFLGCVCDVTEPVKDLKHL